MRTGRPKVEQIAQSDLILGPCDVLGIARQEPAGALDQLACGLVVAQPVGLTDAHVRGYEIVKVSPTAKIGAAWTASCTPWPDSGERRACRAAMAFLHQHNPAFFHCAGARR